MPADIVAQAASFVAGHYKPERHGKKPRRESPGKDDVHP
jgi:hypothetical protein